MSMYSSVTEDEDEGGNIDIDAMERALAQHAEELRLARCVPDHS
jgi:hypothetical protein